VLGQVIVEEVYNEYRQKAHTLKALRQGIAQGKEDDLLQASCGEHIRYRLEAGRGRLCQFVHSMPKIFSTYHAKSIDQPFFKTI
jgi:hypothetical protein